MWRRWQQWYTQGILQSIFEARDQNLARGITRESVQANMEESPSTSRHAMQATIVKAIDACLPPVQARFKIKLRGWRVECGELALACRAVHYLRAAYWSSAPRVAFTLFSAWWNRWTTSRRFQGKEPCCFCGKMGGVY